MSMHGRRRFVAGMGAAFAVGTMSLAVRAAMGPDDKFDLVIKGGELLDPGQKLRARRDIGIRAGRIEAIEADIPVTRASRLLDASGRLVLPGLVDLHSHVYPYGSAIGIPADELIAFQGTTTMVSAGGGARVMCHIGGVATPQLMMEILNTLRPGDILTHCFSGAPNNAGKFTNIVQDGKLLPEALAAKKRGVLFDIGHGGGSFDFTVAEAAMQQGCMPDTISSDIHVFSGNSPGMPYLTWVMSKFMALGFTLEQVVQMATAVPARLINRMPKLGALQVGGPGDATLIEVVQGPVEFVDTRNNKRSGKAYIKPVQAVLAGVPFGRPYQAPFSVR